jgi:hypothetical protein
MVSPKPFSAISTHMQAFIKLQSYKLHLLIAIKNAYNSNGPNGNETCGKIIGKINNYSDVSARMRYL